MSSIPSDRLAEIRARLEAATPGPWGRGQGAPGKVRDVATLRFVADCWAGRKVNSEDTANANLIAHAPDDLAYLLAEVERLRKIEDAASYLEDAGWGSTMAQDRLRAALESQ